MPEFSYTKYESEKSVFITCMYIRYALKDVTTIRITKSTHKEILKIMGEIQARTGVIPTLDDALQEMLENYKKKSKR